MIIFNLKNLLEDAGIEAVVMNEFSSGGAGDLATFDTWPELWIENDRDWSKAETIVNNVIVDRPSDDWFCRGCQEPNDRSFEICWNCGRAID